MGFGTWSPKEGSSQCFCWFVAFVPKLQLMVAGVSFPSILVTLDLRKVFHQSSDNINTLGQDKGLKYQFLPKMRGWRKNASTIVVMELGLSLILHAAACMQTEPKQKTRTGREGWGREREREQGTTEQKVCKIMNREGDYCMWAPSRIVTCMQDPKKGPNGDASGYMAAVNK